MPYQHKNKKSKQFKIKSSSSSEVYGDHRKKIINILVIVAKIIIIQERANLNLTKKISGEFKKIKPPTFNGETEKGEEVESWISGMKKYFQIYNYSNQLKARMAIYNLTGKADIWWQDLKILKDIREKNIKWSTFKKYFKKNFLSEQ